LWQPGIKDGEVNTILGRPYFTSPFMPTAQAGAKTIIFISHREAVTSCADEVLKIQ
ncbi:MAG: phage major capsid protein, partial [Bacteroidales bacterium]|nr:phage major capsid protein [Bacteroidales bacterium]